MNAVKSTIDGMRVSRDTFMSEISSLKAQLKEQNQRLIALNKEKGAFESKKNATRSSEGKTAEQIQQELLNEQTMLEQLREDVKEIKAEVIFTTKLQVPILKLLYLIFTFFFLTSSFFSLIEKNLIKMAV